MAVVEKTVDIIGDDGFCQMLIERKVPDGFPTDIYDDTVLSLRNYALKYLSGVTSITLARLTGIAQESLSSMPGLTKIELPKITTIAAHAMRDNPDLEEVDLPLVTETGNYALVSNPKLKKVNIPLLKTMGSGLLYACPMVEKLEFPRLEVIGEYAVASCKLIEQLDLPSIKSIGRDLVYAESIVKVVNIGPKITTIHADAFRNYADREFVINMAVPEGKVAGAPWGAAKATINYDVPYSGDVPMPT